MYYSVKYHKILQKEVFFKISHRPIFGHISGPVFTSPDPGDGWKFRSLKNSKLCDI